MAVLIETFLPEIIHVLEIMGIAIICFGAVRSFIVYVKMQIKKLEKGKAPVNVKIMLGKSLELGLEYKMGAEILKTVLIRDMSEIWILGAIITLRAMLSVLLYFELRNETQSTPTEQGAAIASKSTHDAESAK